MTYKLSLLPKETNYSFSEKQLDNPNQTRGGFSRVTDYIEDATIQVSVTWCLNLEEWQLFNNFFKAACNNGQTSFYSDLIIDDCNLKTYECYFSNPTLSSFQNNHYYVKDTLQVIVENDSALDGYVCDIYETCNSNSQFVLNLLEKLVNVDWVEA